MGNFWMESSTGLATPHVNSLAVLGTDLYAGTQAGGNFGMGVYRSTDGGNSWTPAGTLGEIVYTLAVHGGMLYAGTHSGGVFRFDGATWIPKGNGLPTPVYALLASGTRLYAGTSNGAFYSEDGGDSWVPINLTGKSVISLFAFGGCLYAGTDSMGTYRSCDEGTTWIPIINPPSNVRAFAAFGASLFAIRGGDVPTGVFRSDDGGDTWVPVNSGLEAYLATRSPTILYSLEVVGNELYLGTYSGGVFRASLMDVLMDVTSMSQLNTFGMRFNRRTGQLSMMATWKNMGADPFYPPLQMVIESITPPSVTVANPDGTTPAGKPYFDFSALIGSDGKLSPGETSGAKQLIFNNPTRVRFNFTVSFWAQVGSGGFPAPPLKVLIEPPPPSDVEIPLVSALAQNFPNPFNPETWIPYALAKASPVQIIIYDIQGRLVRTLDLGHREVGQYLNREKAAYWDGRNQLGEPVGSGVYLYRLQAGEFQATRKMVILK
ncbi:T9SS type A sorting domain-containing protein [Candidatus Poribacteria bacterium]|nr:T9SS type A sorting domain-containing protein [Candidatus Poribacteria bacterium]